MLTAISRRISLAAAALLVSLVLPAAAGSSIRRVSRTQAESSLLREINRVRREHGLRLLHYSARLTSAARAHTEDMASRNYFAHGTFARRMTGFHVRGPFVGENLAWGTGSRGTPHEIVSAWMASPPHRRNLLRPGFRRIGVGEVQTAFLGASDAEVVTADFAGH